MTRHRGAGATFLRGVIAETRSSAPGRARLRLGPRHSPFPPMLGPASVGSPQHLPPTVGDTIKAPGAEDPRADRRAIRQVSSGSFAPAHPRPALPPPASWGDPSGRGPAPGAPGSSPTSTDPSEPPGTPRTGASPSGPAEVPTSGSSRTPTGRTTRSEDSPRALDRPAPAPAVQLPPAVQPPLVARTPPAEQRSGSSGEETPSHQIDRVALERTAGRRRVPEPEINTPPHAPHTHDADPFTTTGVAAIPVAAPAAVAAAIPPSSPVEDRAPTGDPVTSVLRVQPEAPRRSTWVGPPPPPEPATPEVIIGQLDVIVTAPPAQPRARSLAPPGPSALASRRYLRRL